MTGTRIQTHTKQKYPYKGGRRNPFHLMHLLFSISPLPKTLPDQSGPIRDHSRREGSRKRREGELETQEKKNVSVREVGSNHGERGRHARQSKTEDGTQGRARQRPTRKRGRVRGRHAREGKARGGHSSHPTSSPPPHVLHLSPSDYPSRPEWSNSGPFETRRE